jgi:hypothetical protein
VPSAPRSMTKQSVTSQSAYDWIQSESMRYIRAYLHGRAAATDMPCHDVYTLSFLKVQVVAPPLYRFHAAPSGTRCTTATVRRRCWHRNATEMR